jgi:hypothetical protein
MGFPKNTWVPNVMKIRQVGSEFLPRGWTDRHDEANNGFLQLM